MEYIIRYINENIDQKITLSSISKFAGYSIWHFCEKFKSWTGMTFVEYLRSRRMQLASQDLLKGKKVIDIALKYGYETQSGFEKAFLKEFRCTPTEFRNNHFFYINKYEEGKKMEYQLTDRCHILREQIVDEKKDMNKFIGQKAYHYVKGYYDLPVERRSNIMLPASSLSSVINNFKPWIFDGELIVGYNYSDGKYSSSLEEFFNTFPGSSNGTLQEWEQYLSQGELTEEEIQEFIELLGRSDDPFKYPYNNVDPDIKLDESENGLIQEMASVGWCITHNHSIIGYEQVLKYGFRGLLEKVRKIRDEKPELTREQRDLYDAMEMICEASCKIGRKYAELANELSMKCDGSKKEELLEIKKICERVPEYPAETFHEALQSLWFAHIINTWEDGINANSLGRLDQILYPYYKKDIDSGILTKQKAFELICCLWLKLYRDYDVQQCVVGGCDKNGDCAVNDLSYMMLDATEALDFVRCISVRFSQNTPRAFMRRALEVVGRVQKGVPFFFNDDVMIKALELAGIEKEDARDYAAIGCVEICIPGKTNPHAVTTRCNLLKAIEYALNNGKSMMTPDLTPGIETGTIDTFETFDMLKQAVYKQIIKIVDVACKVTNATIPAAAINYPLPYKSILTEGCMESGLDFNAGGPKYNYYQINLVGIPNLADSLIAIKKLVYDEKRYTLDELVYQLKNDYPDEAVRLDFINKAPKYGNDFPEVDELASEIMEFTCNYVKTIPSAIGEGFHAQPFTFVWMVDHGQTTAATPDGRRKGEILAYSMSPMQGRDFNGFTALLNSLSSLPTELAPGTTSAIVEVDPYLFTDRNLDHFVDILMATGKRGLSNIQFNVIDRDTLIDAQKNPDKYKNLAVRVSGFSQKFCLLDEKIQNHIINRTKHRIM